MEHEDVKKQEAIRKTHFLEDELQSTQKVNIFPIKRIVSQSLAVTGLSVLLNIRDFPSYNLAFNSLKNKFVYLGEKKFTVEQIGQLNQPLLHSLPSTLRNIQISSQWRVLVAWEENALCICPVIQEGNP